MEFLKELFGDEALTFEQISAKVQAAGLKVADLSKGEYVAKKKYTDEVTTLNTTITDLQGQIATRDTDLATVRKQLEDGSADDATKIADLTTQLSTLQGDYANQKTAYEEKLSAQAYEFAVREFVNEQKFSSNSAKRDFENQMISAKLTMKDKKILGATDFLNSFKESDPTAFVVEEPTPQPTPEPQPEDGKKPFFVQPTNPTPSGEENPFKFNFTGVR